MKLKKLKISRYTILNIIMLSIFGLIIIRLIYLQIYKYADYKERADVGSTRFISGNAPRGKIYDSEGNILATNNQTYTLTYIKTKEAEENFYETMDNLFTILSDNGEVVQDDLLLKIDANGKFYYDFKTDDSKIRKSVEKRFKRDRGLNDLIQKELFKKQKGDLIDALKELFKKLKGDLSDEPKELFKKQKYDLTDAQRDLFKNQADDLTDAQIEIIDEVLLKITPEDTFYELVKIYDLYELILDPKLKEEGKEKEEAAEIEKFENMSGKEISSLLLEKYSIDDIRNYMVIKDTIKMQNFKGYRNVTISNNIKRDTAFIVYQKLNDLPGINVTLKPIRYYPYKNLGSSVLGYMSSIGSFEEETYKLQGYDAASDLIGTAGIESAFEEYLKGRKGGTTIKVNSKGKETERLFELESYPGNNVHLTIDKDIQYAAQQSLADQINILTTVGIKGEIWRSATRGAVVAIEVKTGRILALASYPDYDPNLFAVPGQLTAEQSEQYFNPDLDKFGTEFIVKTGATGDLDDLFPKENEGDPREDPNDVYPRSFYNYATLGLIPPGSSFKPITALAGLEEGVFSINETVNDIGVYDIHKEELGASPENYGGLPNGIVDVKIALEKSSNFYFFDTQYRIYHKYGGGAEGANKLADYAWKFGLGSSPDSEEDPGTGIEIPERIGTMYTFEELKSSKIENSMHYLVPELKKGYYDGVSFIPFDIEKSDDDFEELRDAKKDLKDKVIARLELTGTDIKLPSEQEFIDSIQRDILKIMDISPKYKKEIEDYEIKNEEKADLDNQAYNVASAIVSFVINTTSEIKTPMESIYAAIGQGISNFTPIELANYMATLANNGIRNEVRLVDKITTSDGELIKQFETKQVDKIDINPENYAAIKEGMWRVLNSGTGYAQDVFRGFPIETAGKTGTADFATDEKYIEIGRQPYSTFGGFAPLDDPEIAVFSVIYDGSRGSFASMPARAVFEAYFKNELIEMNPDYPNNSPMFKSYVTGSPHRDNKEVE